MTGCKQCDCSSIGGSNHSLRSHELIVYLLISNCYHSNTGNRGNYTRCDDGHYDFSVTGCKQCDCSSIGGSNHSLRSHELIVYLLISNCYHSNTGNRGNYTRCDDGHYDFSVTGCKQCDCSSIGGSNCSLCSQ